MATMIDGIRNELKGGFLIVIVSLLSGCAALHSEKMSIDTRAEQGVVYYLPTKPIKFEFVRAKAPTPQDVAKAANAVKTASEKVDSAEEARAEAERIVKNTKSGTSGRAKADVDLQIKTAQKTNAEEDLKKAEKKLIDAVSAQATAIPAATPDGSTEFTDTITITTLPSVADTDHRYTAKLHHLVTRSDKLELKTSAAGLLNTSTATTEDKSAEILITLVQSFAALKAKGSTTFYSLKLDKPEFAVKKDDDSTTIPCGGMSQREVNFSPKPFRFELIFDPTAETYELPPAMRVAVSDSAATSDRVKNQRTDLTPWDYISRSLCVNGADYAFDWRAIGPRLKDVAAPATDRKNWDGLFYRRLLPYQLSILSGKRNSKGEMNSATAVKAVSFDLPNRSPTELLKLTAGGFVTSNFITEFQDGILVAHKEERPSEAMSIVRIPYEIAKALIAIPAEILSLKVDYSTKDAALIDAKTKVINNQKALEDAEKASQKQD